MWAALDPARSVAYGTPFFDAPLIYIICSHRPADIFTLLLSRYLFYIIYYRRAFNLHHLLSPCL